MNGSRNGDGQGMIGMRDRIGAVGGTPKITSQLRIMSTR
jgi:glucose-6-phosphate-specific signal transduction histidine kinase